MRQYHELLQHILDNGKMTPASRNGVRRLKTFGTMSRYDLREGFPIVTTKKVAFRWIAEELFWFLSGDTNEANLRARGVDIWKEWADEAHTSRFGRQEGDLGPIYGYLWRSFGGNYPEMNGVDQIKRLIDEIRRDQFSTRMIVSGWDPEQCDNVDLPPCHTLWQVDVDADGYLSVMLTQRSADCGLGVPYNVSSYAAMSYALAYVTGYKPGTFVHSIGNAHIYENHIPAIREQLTREPYPLPKLEIVDPDGTLYNGGLEALLRFNIDNFKLVGYQSHGKLPMDVAI